MLKGNKGEWTEVYVLLKLLSDGKIYEETSNNGKLTTEAYLDILSVIRKNTKEVMRYEKNGKSDIVIIIVDKSDEKIGTVPIFEVRTKASILLSCIKKINNHNNQIPELQGFLDEMHIDTLKDSGKKSKLDKRFDGKSDILIKYRDLTNTYVQEGFSIKSKLGSSATLFNFSKESNYHFEIINCNDVKMRQVNSIDTKNTKVRDRISLLKKLEMALKPISFGEKFENNLQYVGIDIPKILCNIILFHYEYYERSSSGSKLQDLINDVAKRNPLNFNGKSMESIKNIYESRLKDFLFKVFAGMTSSNEYDGKDYVTGGYIEVQKNGSLIFYRALQNEAFKSYLLHNTKCETPSTNPKKGDFGRIYKIVEDGCEKYCIDLNFSIRFQ